MEYLQLFLSFAKIGVLTFGGGMAMLPMLQRELIDKKHWVTEEEILDCWKNFTAEPQALKLPMAPEHFLNYFEEDDQPQTKEKRMLEKGMAVSMGRLREDTQYDYKFVCVSHNTLRGAAGGAVELAELLAAKGYFD